MKLKVNIKDDMTPVERARAISNGDDYDRVMIDPFLGEIKSRYIGKNIREYWSNSDNLVRAEIESFNRYGYDVIGVGPNAYGIAEAIGIESYYPEKGLVYVKKHRLESIDEVKNLDMITLDSGNLRMYFEATKKLRHIGDGVVPVGISLSGPLTLASFVLGTEKLLKAMIKKPEEVHHLLKYITECTKFIADVFSGLDVGYSLADPIASTTMISPRMYKEYAFPYTKDICEHLYRKYKKRPSYHVCGSTEKVWEYIRDVGVSCFSIDNQINIDDACKYFSNFCSVAGNVDPVRIIRDGSKKEIEENVRLCLESGKKCKSGFILTPGCNLPLDTPDEKIEIFMEAGRKFGRI